MSKQGFSSILFRKKPLIYNMEYISKLLEGEPVYRKVLVFNSEPKFPILSQLSNIKNWEDMDLILVSKKDWERCETELIPLANVRMGTTNE